MIVVFTFVVVAALVLGAIKRCPPLPPRPWWRRNPS